MGLDKTSSLFHPSQQLSDLTMKVTQQINNSKSRKHCTAWGMLSKAILIQCHLVKYSKQFAARLQEEFFDMARCRLKCYFSCFQLRHK